MKIFITGGTSGIGLALCKLYLEQGHEVGICGRDISKLSVDFVKGNPHLSIYQVDVTDREKLKKVVSEFSEDQLDIMIANAGLSSGKKTKIPDFDISRKIFEVNIFGVVNAFEAGLAHMLPYGKGQLVAISSVAGLVGLPGASAYGASKSCVIKYCESLCIGLKKSGIQVTNIMPGFIDTPLTQKNNHKMPWIMPAEKAALKIKNAIDKKKANFIFPWQMKTLMLILEKMPRFFYRFLFGLSIADYTKVKKIH